MENGTDDDAADKAGEAAADADDGMSNGDVSNGESESKSSNPPLPLLSDSGCCSVSPLPQASSFALAKGDGCDAGATCRLNGRLDGMADDDD